jgi:hypothetical protein
LEENRLKRCVNGEKGGDRHSGGGGWICLSVTGVVSPKKWILDPKVSNFFSSNPFPILLFHGSGENRRGGDGIIRRVGDGVRIPVRLTLCGPGLWGTGIPKDRDEVQRREV